MNIKILDSWIREYLDTNAKPADIAKCLSLCGPSVERLEKVGNDFSYDIEITSNRVDSASVLGIAREAATILPQFGFRAKLRSDSKPKIATSKLKSILPIKIDEKLVRRVMAVVIDNVSANPTPDYMKERLEIAGMRSLNSVVDITNYVMLETGHPTHVFDYDVIKNTSMIFRESTKGEKAVSFDGKTYSLPGGDIVIGSQKGEIIDIPGIIGTKNSVVGPNTIRILFFIDNNDPVKIRRTSMKLGIRTFAAVLNEKGVDPELAPVAFERALKLYKEICGGIVTNQAVDIYPSPVRPAKINVTHKFIEDRLGIAVPEKRVTAILSALGFGVKLNKDGYIVQVPSPRASDVTIPEDIVEEVARIYGYHNLPSILMTGPIPLDTTSNTFKLESRIKLILKSLGGAETYTLSLVSKEKTSKNSLRLKNPLGSDSEYLRTSLLPSLIEAVNNNPGEKDPLFLFEVANVYIPRKNDLPNEEMTLGIIFANTPYRDAKGIAESLLTQLNIGYEVKIREKENYKAGSRIEFFSGNSQVGQLGTAEGTELIYFEVKIGNLARIATDTPKFIPIPKYPPQVEDITLVIPEKIQIGELISTAQKVNKLIASFELKDIYQDSYTFNVCYQDANKTLTDKEVEALREKLLRELKSKFGVTVKE